MLPAAAYVPGRAFAPRPGPSPALPEEGLLAHGIQLFDHGFYWEAHEAWERLWQALPRGSAERARLQGLIALAAAGVKARQGQAAGVLRHARRAQAFFAQAETPALAAFAARIEAAAPVCPARSAAPEVVFAERLPGGASP